MNSPVLRSTASLNGLLCALCLGAYALLSSTSPARAGEPEPSLLLAVDSIWQLERPGISILADRLDRRDGSQPARFESDQREAMAYLHTDAEGAQVEFMRKRFEAGESPWGALPRLEPSSLRLLELTLPRKRYLALSGTGEGLFRIGEWQRFGFIHVVDVSQRWAPVHYPLVAEAGLRERVLGRLPGSPVLNYLRLVPSRWQDANTVDAYEVSVLALNPRGTEPVLVDGEPLVFLLQREGAGWTLSPAKAAPVTAARDAVGLAFSAPPAPEQRMDLAQGVAPPRAQPEAAEPAAEVLPAAAAAQAQSVAAHANEPRPAVELPNDPSAVSAREALAAEAADEADEAARKAAAAAAKKKLPQSFPR
jgi:hypothetical protein